MASLIVGSVFLGLLININSYNFGFNNRYICNCLNNERCDTLTGDCNKGCLKGWSGPSCQQENIALDSTYVSQSRTYKNWTYDYGPQLAVDGRSATKRFTNYCTDTGYSPWTWWYIDLKQFFSIGYLKIFYKDDKLSYFEGFSVHIDNKLCFQHTSRSNPPAIIPIQCDNTITGRYVNISNNRPGDAYHFLTLCEVEIYVCSVGTYGSECNNFCYCSNYYDECDVITGRCPNGCQVGWYGDSCNISCSTINKYGEGCQNSCDARQCSGDITCNHVTGNCTDGCNPGYEGIDCSQVCLSGTYGYGCSKLCNNRQCKGSQECNHITGECNDSCKPGYREDDCTVDCSDGSYGTDCMNNCNNRNCLKYSTCDHVTGECNGGCSVGYNPTVKDCTQVCDSGFYGAGCSKKCSDRKCNDNSQCNSKTGECVGGCQPGFQSVDCTQVCDSGFYGAGCSKKCSDRKCNDNSQCNSKTGECVGGCQPGFQSVDCTQVCDSGFYGAGCSKKCSDRKCNDNSQCNSKTGECVGGCQPGFQSVDCTQDCNEGFYGSNCSSNCSARFCQSENQCNNIDGACDCLDGYQGTDCTVIKEATTGDDEGSDSGMTTIVVLVCIIIVIMAVLVGIFLWRKRRSTNGVQLGKKIDTVTFINEAGAKPKVIFRAEGPVYENSASIREATEATASADQSPDKQDETSQLGDDAETNQYGNIMPDFNLVELEEFVIKTIPNEGFHNLYETLFNDFTSSHDVSHLPENRKKNRFKGYYPYDKTRVILKKLRGDPHSDYINANYLNGYDKKFIAAQGTTAVTINDFVRMIWDLKCEKVVMVTKEFEGGKNKCLRYWPEHGTESFGKVKLTLKKEKLLANYTKRYITMERDGKTHEFCHFHYINWPDHDVPDIHDMLDFQYTVNRFKPNSTKPVLVHCSAGVGRTGTYIAIDYCLKRYHDIGKVGVMECVKNLREQRKGMVQTAPQLQFIHEAVIEGIKRGDTAMNQDKFYSEYEKHSNSIKMGNSTLQEQFVYLNSVKNNEETTANKQIINNRTQLYRHSSYTCHNSILFGEIKNVHVKSIWKAVYEAQTPVVLFILDSTHKEVVFPDVDSEETYGEVIVKVAGKSENTISNELNTLTVSISGTQGQPELQVNLIVMNFDISSVTIPQTLQKYIMDILKQMDNFYNDFDPISVFTSDIYYARVFCILMNILQRIRLDDEVEIFNVVRKIHSQFGLTIKSQEEYNTLHEVVFDFVRSRSTDV